MCVARELGLLRTLNITLALAVTLAYCLISVFTLLIQYVYIQTFVKAHVAQCLESLSLAVAFPSHHKMGKLFGCKNQSCLVSI